MFSKKESTNKQVINCEVDTCKYFNSKQRKCELKEISVKKQHHKAKDKYETICSNYYYFE